MSLNAGPAVPATGLQMQTESHPVISKVALMEFFGSPASFDSLGEGAGSWSLTPPQAVKIFARDPNLPPEQGLCFCLCFIRIEKNALT